MLMLFQFFFVGIGACLVGRAFQVALIIVVVFGFALWLIAGFAREV
jgi:hypothetical protein